MLASRPPDAAAGEPTSRRTGPGFSLSTGERRRVFFRRRPLALRETGRRRPRRLGRVPCRLILSIGQSFRLARDCDPESLDFLRDCAAIDHRSAPAPIVAQISRRLQCDHRLAIAGSAEQDGSCDWGPGRPIQTPGCLDLDPGQVILQFSGFRRARDSVTAA